MTDRLTRWEGSDEHGPRAVLAKDGPFPAKLQEALRKLATYEDASEAHFSAELIPREEVEINIYDREEIFENCTVQVLTNTTTGQVSIGWWQNEDDDDA